MYNTEIGFRRIARISNKLKLLILMQRYLFNAFKILKLVEGKQT